MARFTYTIVWGLCAFVCYWLDEGSTENVSGKQNKSIVKMKMVAAYRYTCVCFSDCFIRKSDKNGLKFLFQSFILRFLYLSIVGSRFKRFNIIIVFFFFYIFHIRLLHTWKIDHTALFGLMALPSIWIRNLLSFFFFSSNFQWMHVP